MVPDSRRRHGWPASSLPSIYHSCDPIAVSTHYRVSAQAAVRRIVSASCSGVALRLAKPIRNDGGPNGCLPPSGLVVEPSCDDPWSRFKADVLARDSNPLQPDYESGALPIELANINHTQTEPICRTPHSDPFRVSSAPLDWCGQWSRRGHGALDVVRGKSKRRSTIHSKTPLDKSRVDRQIERRFVRNSAVGFLFNSSPPCSHEYSRPQLPSPPHLRAY